MPTKRTANTPESPTKAKRVSRTTTKALSSEFRAYIFIDKELKLLRWDTRNPARYPGGQVYTQGECLKHPEIKAALGLQTPENVIMVTDAVVWVIEAKRERGQLAVAVKEAKDYADKINGGKNLTASFVSGVAGDEEDGYLIETLYWDGSDYCPITVNGKPLSSLLSPDVAKVVLTSGPVIADVPVDEGMFLAKAEQINKLLHEGGINKNQRARVIAALLLALSEDTSLNLGVAPSVLIGDINTRAQRVLKLHKKQDFFNYVRIVLPPTEDNHTRFKLALVRTVQELNNLNIRSAMNSGADVLGKFYEVFLKYGNGAKEIGIVLTPRHITQFAVDVLGVTDRDVVYDPTCGTGGFLVAAFDAVRRSSSEAAINRFKDGSLFGVDREPEVVALALVNMIFRGDGKNNITEGDCFKKHLARTAPGSVAWSAVPPQPDTLAVTRVLMNPPFALKTSDEKEYKFINQALNQMEEGGLLFSVLPYSAMVKPGGYYLWRNAALLREHTLLCVISFPKDLFSPVVNVDAVGVIIKKGVPHPQGQQVLWVRATTDGFLVSKGKRLPSSRTSNDLARCKDVVRAFVANPSLQVTSIERFQCACPIDFTDPFLELVPENYLEQAPPSPDEIREGIEKVIRDAVAFMVQAGTGSE